MITSSDCSPCDLTLKNFSSNVGALLSPVQASYLLSLKMAEEFDTLELAELWSEEHTAALPTFDNFHNIHQVKLEEALDGLSAKFLRTQKTCHKNQNTSVVN